MSHSKQTKGVVFAPWAIGLGLVLFLVACAPATGARAPWFGTATMGTATDGQGVPFATTIIVHLGYTGDVSNLDVTVTGPNEYARTEAITSRRSRLLMQEMHDRSGGSLTSGTYVVRVTGSGGEETWTIDFDATQTLEPPTITVSSATTTSVEVAWDLVPGARAYEVTLWERTGPTTGQSIPPTAVLNDPTEGRHTFAGLDLDVDGEYWVNLVALDDVDRNDPSGTPRQINTAYQQSSRFAPTASD